MTRHVDGDGVLGETKAVRGLEGRVSKPEDSDWRW